MGRTLTAANLMFAVALCGVAFVEGRADSAGSFSGERLNGDIETFASCGAVFFLILAGSSSGLLRPITDRVLGIFYSEPEIQVFISYAKREKQVAEGIRDKLKRAGVRSFLAHEDMPHGAIWRDELQRALKSCREVWIVVSPIAMESLWVGMELGAGWALDKRIVPIRVGLEPEQLDERLSTWHSCAIIEVDAMIERAWSRRDGPDE